MMSGSNGDGAVESSVGGGVAPFVAKTYGMVNDPATDGAVAWGSAGNSFVVADVSALSRALLPARFGHANFASFVRQLNAHGFRKVDPDRWEFAHASFLRGRTRLLRHIVRRRSSTSAGNGKEDGGTTTLLAMEVVRLKREQRAAEERLAAMWRRVQETERRPKLMLAFLLKAAGVGDPDALRRLVDGFHGGPDDEGAGGKRPRLLLDDGEAVQLAAGNRTMSSVHDGAGVDALLYDMINMQEEVFVPEPSVDFTGFYAGADGLCDVLLDGGAFPADSSY